MDQLIYLDHASTTKVRDEVRAAMDAAAQTTWGNSHSIHKIGMDTSAAIREAEQTIMKCLGITEGELIFTTGGTDANKRIVSALAPNHGEFITSRLEHKSMLSPNHGVIWPNESYNGFKLNTLNRHNKLISLMCINNELGTETDIIGTATAIKEQFPNIIFHSDFTATITKKVPPFKELDYIDAITFSSHKIYGPKGVGCLWVKDPALAKKIKKHRYYGTVDHIGIIGFAKAIELFDAADEISKTNEQATAFLDALTGIHFFVRGDVLSKHLAILPIQFEGVDAITLVMELSDRGVMCSHGSACSVAEANRVMVASGLTEEEAMSTVRFSFGSQISTADAAKAALIVKKTVEELRHESWY